MDCAPGDWIETPTCIAVVVECLAAGLVAVYDPESNKRHVIAITPRCTLLACCHVIDKEQAA